MEITKVREICYVKAREHGFNLYCPVVVNTRFRKTLGRVCYDECGELEKIEFSAQLLEYGTEQSIIDTVLHELAHAFVYLETGEHHGHDATFRAMCARLGTINNGMYAKGQVYEKPREEFYKYTLKCSCCGKVVGHRSRACKITQHPEYYTSGCCGAAIKVIQNF